MKQITREKLAEIYLTSTTKQACKKLGISNVTLFKYVKQNKIPMKGSGNRTRRQKILIVD